MGTTWHACSRRDTLRQLEVEAERGLSSREVERRLREHGPNRLQEAETRPWWRILLAQLNTIVIYLLAGAAVLAFATQRWPEMIAVLAVIVINTGLGFFSEWRAVRSMAALRRVGEQTIRARRDGRVIEVQAPELVPGDIVLLEAGDLVPADLRLLRADRLRVNEAPLTGESVPASKTVKAVAEEAELAERPSMLYKGTSLADGRAEGVTVATGTQTELGRISELTQAAESTATPLQQRLDRLGRRLAWLTIGIALAVGALGLLVRQQEAALVVETALALGIAAIPEGLPIVATIALARGMHLMARRNALVNRLTAVETLGATRIIFTDKTGTLTENRMWLRTIATPEGELDLEQEERLESRLVRRALEIGVLCNDASLDAKQGEGEPKGDPTEVALLAAGERLGVERREKVRTEEFDPSVKKMATFHARDGGCYVAVKGAPSAVLEVCSRIAGDEGDEPMDESHREHWIERADDLASQGLRLLALADKEVDSQRAPAYEDLCFVGLVGLLDPPREDVKSGIDTCQAASIRVEMITGDKPATAQAIAEAVGIAGGPGDPETVMVRGRDIEGASPEEIHRANIAARVSPEQKLDLVRVYQDQGEIVAMTGDGVNDAPALKKADIGIAMGRRGSEAARQVADMVLKDDAFGSIVAAVEQGRIIFQNIRKAVMFMLCTNIAEVLAVTIATVAGWTLPLRPLQILYLNVITDVFPALALGVGPGSGSEMKEPPRDPREPVLTRRHWLETAGWAVLIALCVLASLLLAQHWLGLDAPHSVTVAFLTLAFGKLWFTFNLRDPRSGLFRNEVTRNPWVWSAVGLSILLLLAAVYLPVLSDLLDTRRLSQSAWGLLLGFSLVPLLVGQVLREVQRRRSGTRRPSQN